MSIRDATMTYNLIPHEIQDQVRRLSGELYYSSEAERRQLITELLDLAETCDNAFSDLRKFHQFSSLFIESMGTPLLAGSSSHHSPLFEFMELLSFLPINSESSRYPLLKKTLDPYLDENPDIYNRWNQVQLLYLLTELGDYQNALAISGEMEEKTDISIPELYLPYQLARIRHLHEYKLNREFLGQWLDLVALFYQLEGPDLAIYLIICWIRSIAWNLDADLQTELLQRGLISLTRQNNLNTASVLFDLYFFSSSRSISTQKKMDFAQRLILRLSQYLSTAQLQELHFYSGSYSTGIRENFKESIQYFKFSNYYLNRYWREQATLTRYLRSTLSAQQFSSAMPFIEQRIQLVGNQVSLYNNSYVESLQENYNRIESLLSKVEELSVTDGLTGLKNRRFLEINISQILLLASRHRVSIIFAMLDIDFFKNVNDTWGHQAGDLVLKDLAVIITNEFRKSDVVIRYGGEEFLMIFFDSTVDASIVKMEELRAKVQAHKFMYHKQEIRCTVSIGLNSQNVLVYSDQDIWANIKIADTALYRAKQEGRNRVCLE